jgi:hypothetical protein
MEPINGLDRLTELVRRRSAQTTAADKSTSAKSSATGGQRPLSAQVLEQQLQIKLKQLKQTATPAALRRSVIEAMLAWEMGADMHNEPKFAALVNQIQRHIDSEPVIRQAFEKVVTQLSQ